MQLYGVIHVAILIKVTSSPALFIIVELGTDSAGV